MKIRNPRLVRLARAMAVAGLLAPFGALHAAAPEKQAQSVEALQRENAELIKKNAELERRLTALEAPKASVAVEAAKPVPALREIPADNGDYQFLKLGQDADYLQAERNRIIDQVQQAIPPLYEPARPLHGYVLPPGAARIKLDLGITHNPGDFGRDDFYSKFFNKVKVDTLQSDLQFMYGFEALGVKDMMVNVDIPFRMVRTKGTGHPFRIDAMDMSMNGSGTGLGDISATLKKKWLDQGNGPVTFSSFLGIIFPTGKDDQQFSAAQSLQLQGMPPMLSPLPLNVFGRNPNDRLFPSGLQPGQGAWGGRIGLAATRQFERSALHAGFIYDLFAKTMASRSATNCVTACPMCSRRCPATSSRSISRSSANTRAMKNSPA